jgi:hypothetical protein
VHNASDGTSLILHPDFTFKMLQRIVVRNPSQHDTVLTTARASGTWYIMQDGVSLNGEHNKTHEPFSIFVH